MERCTRDLLQELVAAIGPHKYVSNVMVSAGLSAGLG